MSFDTELMETKEFKKAAKSMGEFAAKELLGKNNEELKELIAINSMHISEATAKIKNLPAYQEALSVKTDLDRALREDRKPLQAAIDLAALVLRKRKEG